VYLWFASSRSSQLLQSPLRLRRVVLVLGDSLTQRSFELGGWASAMQNSVQRRADVICRGFGGYTTRTCEQPARHTVVACYIRYSCFLFLSPSSIFVLTGSSHL
jgi:hypothetical protein